MTDTAAEQLTIADSAGLVVYLATAVALSDSRAWLPALRPRRAHAVAE